MSKQYNYAFIVNSQKLSLGSPVVIFRRDNRDYHLRKISRQSEFCQIVDLPEPMTKEQALDCIAETYVDQEIYQQAVSNTRTKTKRQPAEISAQERLRRITMRVLKAKNRVEQLEQEQQDIQDLLTIVSRG
jgi:hypothetical protein